MKRVLSPTSMLVLRIVAFLAVVLAWNFVDQWIQDYGPEWLKQTRIWLAAGFAVALISLWAYQRFVSGRN